MAKAANPSKSLRVNLIKEFKPYYGFLFLLILTGLISNGLNLGMPRLIGIIIDNYTANVLSDNRFYIILAISLGVIIFVVSLLQGALSSYLSEKLARDYRNRLTAKLADSSFGYISDKNPSNLLTLLTSDVDNVKYIISQILVSALSAIVLLIGSIVLLLNINLRLGLIAISILPIIIVAFFFIFGQVGSLFRSAQENLGKINQVISESVVGAMLIRVLNAQSFEVAKFNTVNKVSRGIGYKIVDSFSTLIPIVNLISNIAIVLIIWFGGHQVASGELSLGQFSAFISYYSLLITPIFILSFISNFASRSFISLGRIHEILDAPTAEAASGLLHKEITGHIVFDNVSLEYGEKTVLKNISFEIKPHTKNAIVGPTAAGKTQLFYLITGLIKPTSGRILIDGHELSEYDLSSLYAQIGLVFQDSLIFNASLKENIQFKNEISEENLAKSIETSHIDDLINNLEKGLDTIVSERGSNLSGGQKQRLMLARSLAIDPKVLLLDDFTARVDIQTEREILGSLDKNYPDLTLLSITQKIEPIKHYDQILLVMEGELLAGGTHEYLLTHSVEYKQIMESQQSTEE